MKLGSGMVIVTTHLGMVYTTYKNGDLGDGYYCFTHMNAVVMHGLHGLGSKKILVWSRTRPKT